ncbi:MAG TPA: hypothetical protein VN836_03875, partial [Verrucomicrobiae bacterium]|nr:hypothetical protein [Verrucomicrobiae bacterium]
EDGPLDIVTVLVLYSIQSNQQEIFIKALAGIDTRRILTRDDLKQLVETGCKRFQGKEIDRIRHEFETAEATVSGSASTNAPSP